MVVEAMPEMVAVEKPIDGITYDGQGLPVLHRKETPSLATAMATAVATGISVDRCNVGANRLLVVPPENKVTKASYNRHGEGSMKKEEKSGDQLRGGHNRNNNNNLVGFT